MENKLIKKSNRRTPWTRILLTLSMVCCFVIGTYGNNSNRDTVKGNFVLQFGLQLIQDESFDKNYINDGAFARISEGTSSFYGNLTPAIGLSYTHKENIKGFPIRLEHTIGFQYARQLYRKTSNFNIVTDSEGRVTSFESETYATEVTKYFCFYRAGAKASLFKHFFIGPLAQVDVNVGNEFNEPSLALALMGALDVGNNKLSNHSPVLLKYGGQVGGTIKGKVQIGINVLYGINRSITITPDHKWRNTQGGLFVNVKL